MTLEAAILSFYLLFPVLTDGQVLIDRALSRNVLSEREKIQMTARLLDFLSGKHVIDDSAMIINANVPLLVDKIGLGAEEVAFKTENGKIHLLEFGIERFSTEVNPVSSSNTVYANNRQFQQTSYDDHYRVLEKTLWQNGEKSSDIKLLQRTVFSYEGESGTPSSVYYEYVSKKRAERITYNTSGNPVKIQSYIIQTGKETLLKSLSYSYDSKQRIVSQNVISYDKSIPNSKTVYTYTKKSDEPDVKHYESGVLRSSTVHESNDRYSTTTYFENRYSITVTFQNKKKVKEVVYLNGVRQRERVFDE